MDRRSLKKLKKEASLGHCLKEAAVFHYDVETNHWKCPFCENYGMNLPRENEKEAWFQCQKILNAHLDAHRSVLLQATALETLQKYEKQTKESSRRARIWVSGTMRDRGY